MYAKKKKNHASQIMKQIKNIGSLMFLSFFWKFSSFLSYRV